MFDNRGFHAIACPCCTGRTCCPFTVVPTLLKHARIHNRTRHRGGSGHVGPGQTSRPAPVPEGVGYALGYRKPKMTFNETRQAAQYVEDLRGVLGLTVREYCRGNAYAMREVQGSTLAVGPNVLCLLKAGNSVGYGRDVNQTTRL